jgi:hypothetical protein
MSGRQSGKAKPLRVNMPFMTQIFGRCSFSQAPKKAKKEEDEEDVALKAKKKAEAEALKTAKEKGINTT